jgi:RHS repeat-associated protein
MELVWLRSRSGRRQSATRLGGAHMLGPAEVLRTTTDLSGTKWFALRAKARVTWRHVVAAGLATVALVGLLALVAGDLGAVHPGVARSSYAASRLREPAVLVASRKRASLARLRQSALEQEARRHGLESPAARAQRVASRMAFHGLSTGAAQRLLVRDYGSVLTGVSANPAVSVARSGRVVRYLNDYRAVVRTPSGLQVETSSVPLRVGGSAGSSGSVDLRLQQNKREFSPVRPLVGMSIARDSGGGVAIGNDGLRVMLQGADVPGRMLDRQDVFFGKVGPDVDATVAPKLSGVDLSVLLRSRLSPQQFRYRLALPSGAVLLPVAGGGAAVSRAGVVLASIPAPSAHDAQGVFVPVKMAVADDELVLTVAHREHDFAYPILADPEVVVANLAKHPEEWSFVEEGSPLEHSFPTGGPITVSTSGTLSGYSNENWNRKSGGFYEWSPPIGVEEITGVEFLGVSGSVSVSGVEGPPAGYVVQATISACRASYSNRMYYEDGEPFEGKLLKPTIRVEDHHEKTEEEERYFCNKNSVEVLAMISAHDFISSEEPPKFESVTASASISVGSVLIYQKAASGEEAEREYEKLGEKSKPRPHEHKCFRGFPVNCATGNQVETQTDFSVGGRGLGLNMTRTYNSLLAAREYEEPGPFGYGWTDPYSAHVVNSVGCHGVLCNEHFATVTEADGSTVRFERFGASETWHPVGPLVEATLAYEGTGYVYTLPDQSTMRFNKAGQLTSESDRNGNTLTMSYESKGRLESVSDASGRKLTFTYNSEGFVESVKDPMGHTVKYTYESEDLASVTQPGETKLRWKFKYNAYHELTSETDGREHAVTTEYNINQQVSAQTDALSRKRKWEYFTTETGTETKITEPNGSTTVEKFNAAGLPTSITRAYGTSIAATTSYEYNASNELAAVTDPNKHKTEYGYDASGNLTSEKNADSDEAKWKYDSKHNIETETTPDGETTTIKRNSAGDPEVIERPAPGSATQKTTYKYDADGDVESMTNPLEHTWKYEYDSYGDRKAETDPEGNKRTWEYNEDSQETAEVSPRGNAAGAKASEFTTKTERDAQGRALKITDPLGHTTKYTYDGDGNVETMIDGNSHTTKYTYDADNELTKTEAPNKAVTETEYDSMGQVKSQTDGNKHVTKYVRNALEEVEEAVNPLAKKTLKEYDAAGNLVKLTDPAKRTTTYTYDPANRLTEISYSSGKPATIKYEYNKDGDRTKMIDGTGTTTYTLDQLDRMTESENGHKEVVKYEYNLGNQQTKITYPNTKVVERAYDKDGRLEKVTDWNKNETIFKYSADSQLEKTVFPSATKNEDTYVYNDADQMTEVKMDKSTEVLASLVYTRDNDGQVKKTTTKGLPGAEVTENAYDENNRLTKYGSTEYKYDAANNPTKEGSSTNTYNEGDELEKGTGVKYTYDELGERTKTTPEKGPATTYGYDQAGNLTSAERPKEGETSEIKDTYTYNGEDLRTSQTISGTTSYLAWDMAEELPLVLGDGTSSYIYGPGGLPIEQISSGGTVTYLHHDQQGSIRLLTGSTGTVTGKCTYGAYGTPTCEGTTTTPLGFDAQYTSSDTGLVYMRARVYDPATAQFLSIDPFVALTGEPYSYAEDDPINKADPSGRCGFVCVGGIVLGGVAVATGVGEVVGAGALVGEGTLGLVSAVSGGAGAIADGKECLGGSGIACVGAGVGGVASLGAGSVVVGLLGGDAAAGATAIGVSSGATGFLSDLAGALAPSSASATSGCG